ncbi:unnamed protein product [Cuscuta campestris]|uniref:Uncharacterized protein n=1 Tax=Cuscuta campestris TaxID=132261 RepID=A0A484NPX2_9ASTE|nr:unnamed protein product [Cuscuta campestris]
MSCLMVSSLLRVLPKDGDKNSKWLGFSFGKSIPTKRRGKNESTGVVIMEGDPHPGARRSRMSFQNFNPVIDVSKRN